MTAKLVTLAVLGAAALGLAASWTLMAQTAGRTVRDGVFTSEQAERERNGSRALLAALPSALLDLLHGGDAPA